MASRIGNPDWQEEAELKQYLKRYILQKLSRREILDFVSRDYAQYAWSLGTLSRRLAYFDIKYIEYNTDLNDVQAALQSELQGAAGTFTSMVSVFFITANSSAHNLCFEILIFFYLEVKPLDYVLHIVPVRCYVVDFPSVYPLLSSLKML